MRHLHLGVQPLKLAVSAALWAVVLCRPAPALDGHDATRLHILIVADTNDENIGKHCAVDWDRVENIYLDTNKDGRVDWPEFFGRVQTATNSMSKQLAGQIAERDRRLGVASPPQPQGQEPEVLGDWARVVRPPIPKSKWR